MSIAPAGAVEEARHLYIHIPFCPSKCSYCAFVTHIGSDKLIEPYVQALCLHATQQRARYPSGPLETVYFGGGTPSTLSPDQIGSVLECIQREHGLAPEAEITMEAHPATISESSLRGYRERGVNRISFGAESLVEAELIAIGRTHGRTGVEKAMKDCREAGFANVALDLMYGLPGQTQASWHDTLATALQLLPDHLSLYPLSIEPRTVFARRLREGTLSLPDDERVVSMYHAACVRLREAGYEHYEVSNWALPGRRCRHNMAYWLNSPYLALGVGAHSYLPPHRRENVHRVQKYIDMVGRGEDPTAECEPVTRREEIAETIMLRLRLLADGLDTTWLDEHFGWAVRAEFKSEIDDLVSSSLLTDDGHILRIPENAVPLANETFSRFM